MARASPSSVLYLTTAMMFRAFTMVNPLLPTRPSTDKASLMVYHSADSNRDGKMSLLELTRVIELYNTRTGTTRTGAYKLQSGTEDGFAPGP